MMPPTRLRANSIDAATPTLQKRANYILGGVGECVDSENLPSVLFQPSVQLIQRPRSEMIKHVTSDLPHLMGKDIHTKRTTKRATVTAGEVDGRLRNEVSR